MTDANDPVCGHVGGPTVYILINLVHGGIQALGYPRDELHS